MCRRRQLGAALAAGLTAVLLVACATSSTKSVINVSSVAQTTAGRDELRELVRTLAGYHDGCFAPHRARMDTRELGGQMVWAFFRLPDPDVSAELSYDPAAGTLRVKFDEWYEKRFTRYGEQCYKQLLFVLENRYGKERVSVQ